MRSRIVSSRTCRTDVLTTNGFVAESFYYSPISIVIDGELLFPQVPADSEWWLFFSVFQC